MAKLTRKTWLTIWCMGHDRTFFFTCLSNNNLTKGGPRLVPFGHEFHGWKIYQGQLINQNFIQHYTRGF